VLHNLSFVEDPTRVFRAIRFEQRFVLKIAGLPVAYQKCGGYHCFRTSQAEVFLWTEADPYGG
jgi:hypothetical protein